MKKWTVEKIKDFYTYLNEYFGLLVNPEVITGEKSTFPLQWNKGKLLFIPEFFNDDELKDDVRMNLLVTLYSAFYLAKYNDNHIGMNPMFMTKGICNELGFNFLSESEIESNLRVVRRKLYQDIEHCCYFKVGYDLRESAFTSYKVTKVEKLEGDIWVTVKPIGSKLRNPEKVFSEEELYNRCCTYENIDDVKVDMRKNIVVISGPSGTGKTIVLNEILKKHLEINKAVSVTTRKPRSDEVNGKDYYFVSKDEFYDYILDGLLLEYGVYDEEHYGTLLSEIDKYSTEKLLALVIEANGRRKVLRHYPLAKTIFIQPPSLDELRKQIEFKGENSEDEIDEGIEIAFNKMEDKRYYDYVITNEDTRKCADEIAEIIKREFK